MALSAPPRGMGRPTTLGAVVPGLQGLLPLTSQVVLLPLPSWRSGGSWQSSHVLWQSTWEGGRAAHQGPARRVTAHSTWASLPTLLDAQRGSGLDPRSHSTGEGLEVPAHLLRDPWLWLILWFHPRNAGEACLRAALGHPELRALGRCLPRALSLVDSGTFRLFAPGTVNMSQKFQACVSQKARPRPLPRSWCQQASHVPFSGQRAFCAFATCVRPSFPTWSQDRAICATPRSASCLG